MAKGAYTGVGGVARRVKSVYVGVGAVARRVKKGYIGVGGLARLFLSRGVEYHGKISSLSQARASLAATVGSYALFGGGRLASNDFTAAVDSYNTSLTKGTPASLGAARGGISAASNGSYALFAGGVNSDLVEGYNGSLVKTTAARLNTSLTRDMAGAGVGGYAFFAGGIGGGPDGTATTCHVYDSALTKRSSLSLGGDRGRFSATTASVGSYALVAGGVPNYTVGHKVNFVDAFSSSLVRTGAAALSEACAGHAGARAGNYALFVGGEKHRPALGDPVVMLNTVNCYSASLAKTTGTVLSRARCSFHGTTLDNHALFAGGFYPNSSTNAVDIYDQNLVRSTAALAESRDSAPMATVGQYAIAAGGYRESGPMTYLATVEAFSC